LPSFPAFVALYVVALALSDDVALHSMADTATEPLIAATDARELPNDEHAYHDETSEDEQETEVDESSLTGPGRFIWILTFCAGVSGLLFGYEYVHFFLVASYPLRLD
jgi:hypothetical protein